MVRLESKAIPGFKEFKVEKEIRATLVFKARPESRAMMDKQEYKEILEPASRVELEFREIQEYKETRDFTDKREYKEIPEPVSRDQRAFRVRPESRVGQEFRARPDSMGRQAFRATQGQEFRVSQAL
jgi:hypothetical protein